MTLTLSQRQVLQRLASYPVATLSKPNARIDVLDRLRSMGLIYSASPLAYQYHAVMITDKGRDALHKDIR